MMHHSIQFFERHGAGIAIPRWCGRADGAGFIYSSQVTKLRDKRADSILQHIEQNMERYFPGEKTDDLMLELHDVKRNAASTVYRMAAYGDGFQKQVLVKAPPLQKAQARHSEQAPAEIKFRSEYQALVQLYDHFNRAGDSSCAAIRPLDFIEPELAIVMEYFDGRSLKSILAREACYWRKNGNAHIKLAMQRAGAWLRTFHAFGRKQCEEARIDPEKELHASLQRSIDYLREKSNAGRWLDDVQRGLLRSAEEELQQPAPMCLKHGDFAPRNLLLSPDGKIAGIDTQARVPALIYQDIAYFILQLHASKLQVYSLGMTFRPQLLWQLENEFLRGYFNKSAIPLRAIRLYQGTAALEKWAQQVLRIEEGISLLRKLPRALEKAIVARFYRDFLERLMQEIAESSSPAATLEKA